MKKFIKFFSVLPLYSFTFQGRYCLVQKPEQQNIIDQTGHSCYNKDINMGSMTIITHTLGKYFFTVITCPLIDINVLLLLLAHCASNDHHCIPHVNIFVIPTVPCLRWLCGQFVNSAIIIYYTLISQISRALQMRFTHLKI